MVEENQKEVSIVPNERIVNQIFLIRKKKVMVDRDLAELYGVETRVLNQAVRRNSDRFPDDFMFQLNKRETEIWTSQIVMSKSDKKGIRRSPFVFTEQGVAMLSSVLNSKRAIQVNIQIMRTFTRIRQLLDTNEVLSRKIEVMEKKYDGNFKRVFWAIGELAKGHKEDKKPKSRLGFDTRKTSPMDRRRPQAS